MALSSTGPSLASDATLQPFLAPSFDPVDYLNATLPSWSPPATSTPTTPPSLADVSNQTQSIVTQLNAQLTRLSATLTQLTDDILRSGTRLAYEVEVLRGDASSLSDALTGRLKKDIETFLPPESLTAPAAASETTARSEADVAPASIAVSTAASTDIKRLHTLSLVRDRLDGVIKTFGEASAWPLPPSEVLSKSNFISVAGPESTAEDASKEQEAKAYEARLRAEVLELVGDGGDADAALRRVESLRQLAEVWKGTSEERARLRFVDSLARAVDEQRKANAGSGYSLGASMPRRTK